MQRTHAFARGVTVPVPASGRGAGWRLGTFLLSRLIRSLDSAECRLAADSFFLSATVGAGCRVGSGAWCTNFGQDSHIRLGDQVICRGVLRWDIPPFTLAAGNPAQVLRELDSKLWNG